MRSLFYLCNALDDATRLERQIVTDSPAASRKIFLVSGAARTAKIRAWVVSMGRGKQNGSGAYFPFKVARVNGVPTVYLPFIHLPLLSQLLTLFAFLPLIWRFSRRRGEKTVLLYNRFPAYIFALLLARLRACNTVLDLEDGATDINDRSFAGSKARLIRFSIDSLCSGGALLACDALAATTTLRPTRSCYGTSEIQTARQNWQAAKLHFLFGGTVSADAGALWLIDAIKYIRKEAPAWAEEVVFDITGKGDAIDLFRDLAHSGSRPAVVFHGRTTNAEYEAILANTHIGLSLRLNQGILADTTFPSKVVEFSSNNIMVVTTDVSDVRKVFGSGAIYLEMNDVAHLVEKLRWIVENRAAANAISAAGMHAAAATCSARNVGRMLSDFLFPAGTESKS